MFKKKKMAQTSPDPDVSFKRDSAPPGPDLDCLSMKSDRSKEVIINFKRDSAPPGLDLDCLSMKSDFSKDAIINFKRDSAPPGPDLDCLSMKSDFSKDAIINFKRKRDTLGFVTKTKCKFSASHESLRSKPLSIDFKSDFETLGQGLSCQSTQSDRSKDTEAQSEGTEEEPCPEHLRGDPHLLHIFMRLEEIILSFVKEQLRRFYKALATDCPEFLEHEEEQSTESLLNISVDFLRRMKQEPLAERLHSQSLRVCRDELKRRLQQKFSSVSEGIAKAGHPTLLNEIYTEVYITEGGAAGVNQEHEVRHIETMSRTPAAPETAITCQDLFKGHEQRAIREEETERQGPIRTVLTKGVAGVGKTVLTQKFSLDWAEGRANQDIQQLFPFTFRELNVLRDRAFSLVGLLQHFFSEIKGLCRFSHQVLFILDGLDECRIPLDFSGTRVLTDPTECVSLEVLLVNLIRGSLLPSARLWITTRPAAAGQIPAECVSMVTEVRGFTDSQKEEYFRKRFRDEQLATAMISHIKRSPSLFIMCHLPVFSWMVTTVLQHVAQTGLTEQLPQTMTEMYIHFLVVQAKVKSVKYDGRSEADYHWSPETRRMVEALAKLAFEQLQKGNLIFYESDLSECGLDTADAAVYSGVFTEVFREEPGLYQDKVYCFIHLSVQEFLAALHVHLTFFNSGVNLLPKTKKSRKRFKDESDDETEDESEERSQQMFLLPEPDGFRYWDEDESDEESEERSQQMFYDSAVDQALESPNGHLDLFLRFLSGLSLPTNQSRLSGLLTQTGSSTWTNAVAAQCIKKRIKEDEDNTLYEEGNGLSAETRMNLFHCLNELKDHSLVEQVQQSMREGRFTDKDMSVSDWSAVAFLVLSSDSDLDEFDLRKYQCSDEALQGLLPLIKASSRAILPWCGLDLYISGVLKDLLSSSTLTHLDLNDSSLRDRDVRALCDGLKSAPCRLQTLILSKCFLTRDSCVSLASLLSSSSLTHLDLSNTDLTDSVVEELCVGLKSAPCRLEVLRLSGCLVTERGGASLASAVGSAHSRLRELDLSYNHPGPSAELLTAVRDDPLCSLDSLRLDPAGERWMVPGLRKYLCEVSLDPNTANNTLELSEDKRSVTNVEELHLYPHHSHRFTSCSQVLSSTALTGRCYFEVKRSGDVDIAVSYSGIRRNGDSEECRFGDNDQSWSLRTEGTDSVCHCKREIQCRLKMSDRVGVLLDSEAGVLSFYNVLPRGEWFPLQTFSCSFSEPLFVGFGLKRPGSSVTLLGLTD